MSKTFVEFSKDELKQLLKDKNSCVSAQKNVLSLALYPSHLGDISSSIKELLNTSVAKYDKKLGGILLGYKNVKLLTSEGTIVTDSCHVHIDIEADFYIFKPEVGCTLTGIVNKTSEDHVGCLVHRIFNVSVPKEEENDDWVGYLVEISQEVILKITYINLQSRLPYIRATFEEESIVLPEPSKKKKLIDDINEETQNNIEDELIATPVYKKKRRKSNISESINSYEEENDIISPKKKSKRKSKENLETEDVEEEISKEKRKKEKRKSKEIEQNDILNSSLDNLDLNSKKHIKNTENIIKKKKHSKLLDTSNDKIEESNIKKKEKKINQIDNINSLEDEQMSTPVTHRKNRKSNEIVESISEIVNSKDRKSKENRKSYVNGTTSWEDIKLALQGSQLERDLAESSMKEKKDTKKSRKESINDSNSEELTNKKRKRDEMSRNGSINDSNSEEFTSKKRKRDEMVPDDETPAKKHKSKRKKHSVDIVNQT